MPGCCGRRWETHRADYNPPNCDKWAAALTSHFAPPMRDPSKPTGEKGDARKARKEAEEEEREAEEARERSKRQHSEDEGKEDSDWQPDGDGEDGQGLKDARGRRLNCVRWTSTSIRPPAVPIRW
jgi:hypothetical protein